MTGSNLATVFHDLSPDLKQNILAQMAQIVVAMQNGKPKSVVSYGGILMDNQSDIISGPCAQFSGGPFGTLAEYYQALAAQNLKEADSSIIIDGWRANGFRARIDEFLNTGLTKLCATIEADDPSTLVFVHGDMSRWLSLRLPSAISSS